MKPCYCGCPEHNVPLLCVTIGRQQKNENDRNPFIWVCLPYKDQGKRSVQGPERRRDGFHKCWQEPSALGWELMSCSAQDCLLCRVSKHSCTGTLNSPSIAKRIISNVLSPHGASALDPLPPTLLFFKYEILWLFHLTSVKIWNNIP